MTEVERALGGIEFPADTGLGYSALDREDYLAWAFQSLRNPTMAALLWDYDLELLNLIGYPVSATNERAPNPFMAPWEDDGSICEDAEDEDERFIFMWSHRQMYLDYAFNRLSRPEKVRLLRHCERDLLRYIQSTAPARS